MPNFISAQTKPGDFEGEKSLYNPPKNLQVWKYTISESGEFEGGCINGIGK